MMMITLLSITVLRYPLDSDDDRQLDLPQAALHDQAGHAEHDDGRLRGPHQDSLQ